MEKLIIDELGKGKYYYKENNTKTSNHINIMINKKVNTISLICCLAI